MNALEVPRGCGILELLVLTSSVLVFFLKKFFVVERITYVAPPPPFSSPSLSLLPKFCLLKVKAHLTS